MTETGFWLYVAYALVQAILLARFLWWPLHHENPVPAALLFAILAPLISVSLALMAIYALFYWLCSGRFPWND